MTTALALYAIIKNFLFQKKLDKEAIQSITFTEAQNEFLKTEFSSKYQDYPVEANEFLQYSKFFKMPVEITDKTGQENIVTINVKDEGLFDIQIDYNVY